MILSLLIWVACIGWNEGAIQTTEERLLKHLKLNHNKLVRPVTNISLTVNATFGIELIQLIDMDERNQLITNKVWVRQTWTNMLMVWNPSEWDNITDVKVDNGDVWTPDIVLFDNAAVTFSGGIQKYKTQIILKANGVHAWYSPAVFTSTCNIDILYFPFDRQVCFLKFASWAYDITGLNLQLDNRPVVTHQYINSSEWEVVGVKKTMNILHYGCCPQPFTDVTFKIFLKRKPLFYVFNVIAPCLVLSLTILFGFIFPPESGERISLIVTILLAMAVFMQIISGTLPVNSDGVPIIAVFYMVILIESVLSLSTTCVILIVHHRSDESKIHPMPQLIRKFFILIIAQKLGYWHPDDTISEKQSPCGVEEIETEIHAYDNKSAYKRKMVKVKKGNRPRKRKTTKSSQWIALQRIERNVNKIVSDQMEENRIAEINSEWKILGKVLDWAFFVIFLLTIAISALAILLPSYYAQKKDITI